MMRFVSNELFILIGFRASSEIDHLFYMLNEK